LLNLFWEAPIKQDILLFRVIQNFFFVDPKFFHKGVVVQQAAHD
jgi:hypothetical protein